MKTPYIGDRVGRLYHAADRGASPQRSSNLKVRRTREQPAHGNGPAQHVNRRRLGSTQRNGIRSEGHRARHQASVGLLSTVERIRCTIDVTRGGRFGRCRQDQEGKLDTTMTYDFDKIIDRKQFESIKWHRYGEDVLPMWVADMDFEAPAPVIRALQERVEHGVFGYGKAPDELPEVVVERLRDRYNWQVSPEALIFLPGVVPGFNLTCHAVASPGEGVLIQTPIYYPILHAPGEAGLTNDEMALTRGADGTYEIDFDLMERTISERTRVFILCNPHNPVGRVFRRDELERMADVCLRNNIIICSDEIHCDLVLDNNVHIPIASLSPEVGQQTVTLMAPSKTYNIAGLKCSVAIVENPELRKRLCSTYQGLMSSVNILGYTAALAAYRDGQPWLDAALRYLELNRDYVFDFVRRDLPGVRMANPEGTYLAWLSCHESAIRGNPHEFFLKQARVALNDGAAFGGGGEGFVRLNFGCPRSTLVEGLRRMKQALSDLSTTQSA